MSGRGQIRAAGAIGAFTLALFVLGAILASSLHFQFRFLPTDIAVWILVLSMSLFLVYASGREQYRVAWRQIRIRKLPMICAGILGLYLAVSLLDSIHLNRQARGGEKDELAQDASGDPVYETDTLSLLDLLVKPIREGSEKTFSAPLAIYQFNREADPVTGERTRPRLMHGGELLETPDDHASDVLWLVLRGLLFGLLVGGVPTTLLVIFLRRRAHGQADDAKEIVRRWLWIGGFVTIVAIGLGIVTSLASHYHLLGTDKVGRDVFYQALKGCRTGLVIGTVTTLIATPFAILLGIAAGYFGGRIDDLVQYLYTTLGSIPGILLIAAAMLIVQIQFTATDSFSMADRKLLWLCLVLGLTGWSGLCRLLRGETLKLREQNYVEAAHGFGVGHATIMFRHILPNLMHIVLISVILRFSGLVLAEAVLAYVGIGVDPSMASWGNMINSARLEISRDPIVWWNLLGAFVFMFGLVLPANLFGDAVRDALDPRLRTE